MKRPAAYLVVLLIIEAVFFAVLNLLVLGDYSDTAGNGFAFYGWPAVYLVERARLPPLASIWAVAINTGVAFCVFGLSSIGVQMAASRKYNLKTLLAAMLLVAILCGLLVAAKGFPPPPQWDL